MTKKLSTIIVLILFTTILTGCGASSGKVVEKFFEALDKGKIEEAIGYLSSSTQQALGYDKWQAVLIESSNQMSAQGGLKSVDITEEEVNGDIATVTFKLAMQDGSQETDSLDLIKEDGDWKIHIDPWAK